MSDVKVGSEAPDFKAAATGGREVSLSDYKGRKKVVLFFFPGAFTPVCSSQVVDFQRSVDKFRAADAEVIGISVDSRWVLDVFSATSGGLSYILASDLKRDIGTQYGVFLADRGLEGRAIFVIGKDGRVAWHRSYELKQAPDVNEVLEAVKKA
jgi:peroxiredoxin